MKVSVKDINYDEDKGTLNVYYTDGNSKRFYLVTPEIYDKRYDFENLADFVRKYLVFKCPSVST